MARITAVSIVDETDGLIRLAVSTPGVPTQFYYAQKVQPPLPDGDSRKIIVCNADGSPKPPVTYWESGEVASPYIGCHLDGFDKVVRSFEGIS